MEDRSALVGHGRGAQGDEHDPQERRPSIDEFGFHSALGAILVLASHILSPRDHGHAIRAIPTAQ
jgi:hypothetical protein